jgi:alginate O-acetyltransferase complex protein AlgI
MSFVDIRFLVFLPVVFVLHYAMPERFRWLLLLIASYIFYAAWKPEYTVLLFAITVLDFVAGINIAATENKHMRRVWLGASLIGNLGILFVFKYFNFAFASIEAFLAALKLGANVPFLTLVLPIGISFHVFQSISYTVDVYKKKVAPTRHLGKFALFVSFFPQLVAGPIERPTHLLQQILRGGEFELDAARNGMKLIAWGYFKKLVIADNLAPAVAAVYAAPSHFPGPSLIIATFLFAYQLYCDFSGYTDIARGVAKLFGYDLMLNFERPYAARSVGEFWRRWHISLSSWLRDYLYYPLAMGGKRITPVRLYASLVITFVLIGLWHGANWTYVMMGFIFGCYLVIGSITESWRNQIANKLGVKRFPALRHTLQVIITFSLVSLAWIFFRAPDLHTAFYFLTHLFSRTGEFINSVKSSASFRHVVLMDTEITGLHGMIIAVPAIVFLETVDYLRAHGKFAAFFSRVPRIVRFCLYAAFAVGVLVFGQFATLIPFIYFQF